VLARCRRCPGDPDGEIVALHDERPDFGFAAVAHARAAARRHAGRGRAGALLRVRRVYQGQDVLIGRPYTERRAGWRISAWTSGPFRTPPWHRGGGDKVLAESITKGLEGVVGKPLSSAYHPGQRRDWIKIKNVKQQEVIICGWAPGEGRRPT